MVEHRYYFFNNTTEILCAAIETLLHEKEKNISKLNVHAYPYYPQEAKDCAENKAEEYVP